MMNVLALIPIVLQLTVSGTVNIKMQANDPTVAGQTTSGIATVKCLLDNLQLGPILTAPTISPDIYQIVWDTTAYVNGAHTLTAQATDKAGNVGTASMPVTISNTTPPDMTPPTIQFLSPIAGSTVGGKINVQSSATDNTAVSQMQLFIQGQLKKTTSGSSITYNWNTSPYKKQTVPLTTTAIDPSGNLASQTITVRVQ